MIYNDHIFDIRVAILRSYIVYIAMLSLLASYARNIRVHPSSSALRPSLRLPIHTYSRGGNDTAEH